MILTVRAAKKIINNYTVEAIYLLGKDYLKTLGEGNLWDNGKCIFWGLKVIGIPNAYVDFPRWTEEIRKSNLKNILLKAESFNVLVTWREEETEYTESLPF